jgi:hypothetical protein
MPALSAIIAAVASMFSGLNLPVVVGGAVISSLVGLLFKKLSKNTL